MKARTERGIWGNISDLFTERNRLSGRVENTDTNLSMTNETVSENQILSDEMILDHEERLILLEVGE